MDSITLQTSVTIARRSEVFGAYVRFRTGLRAHETRHWTQVSTGIRFSVDVDKQNVPIGLEVVRYNPPPIETTQGGGVPKEQLLLLLFVASSQLAAILKMEEDDKLIDRGEDILKEITESLPFFPDNSSPGSPTNCVGAS